MFKVLLPIILASAAAMQQNDTSAKQLQQYKNEIEDPGKLTTDAGAPVDNVTATTTLDVNELLIDQYFVETLGHFDREKIPGRVVHPQGSGAFGYFEVTHDITDICRANLFSEVGKTTPIAVRFSTVAVEKGSSEFTRDSRGFAVKFYTKEGNYDIAAFNSEMFAIRDPLLLPEFIHASKFNPVTNLPDSTMLWDFVSYHPETLYRILYTFSEYGLPNGYRYMSGHGIHTFEVYNKHGTKHFVRIHFIPDLGEKYLNSTQVSSLSSDANYFTRDLYNAIANGKYPSWTMKMQILTQENVSNADFDVFDVTKILPHKLYPFKSVGKLVLNRNPVNYFAEVEQLAFCPINLVPGVLGSPDKLFVGRSFAYRDTQIHRLGENFAKIPVNSPLKIKVRNYNRDGVAPVNDNGGSAPWYYPNSFNGSQPHVEKNRPSLSVITEIESSNFEQINNFYSNELNSYQRTILIENLHASLCLAENFIQAKVVTHLKSINSGLANRVNTYLVANCKKY